MGRLRRIFRLWLRPYFKGKWYWNLLWFALFKVGGTAALFLVFKHYWDQHTDSAPWVLFATGAFLLISNTWALKDEISGLKNREEKHFYRTASRLTRLESRLSGGVRVDMDKFIAEAKQWSSTRYRGRHGH